MHTEVEPGESARDLADGEREPVDRDERRITAIIRAFGPMLEPERHVDVATLRKIDAALRGDRSDD